MRRLIALLLSLLVVAAACGDDGDSAEDTVPDETEAPAATDAAPAEPVLTSTAFADGDAIPVEHAGCDGENLSPPLEWQGVPDDAAGVAVTFVDPDADGFVHWVIGELDAAAGGIEEGEIPSTAVEAVNDTGSVGYFGPCPPEEHTYVFTLHVLDEDPGLESGMDGQEAVVVIDEATAASATLSGTYAPAEG